MYRRAFSMIEVAVALFLVAIAFLPIYNLFRYSSHGTSNNIYEVTASNYASDMIDFIKTLKPKQIREANSSDSADEITLADDTEIAEFFKKIKLTAPSAVVNPYKRNVKIQDKWHKSIWEKLKDLILSIFKKRQYIDSMVIKVEVTFPKPDKTKGLDKVSLYSIVME